MSKTISSKSLWIDNKTPEDIEYFLKEDSENVVYNLQEDILCLKDKIAELENPWISVDDRLPEPKAKILLHSDSLEVFSGRGSVLIATNTMTEPVLGIRSRYTHWMPQPLPKEQE
jgi:hypothetical protein